MRDLFAGAMGCRRDGGRSLLFLDDVDSIFAADRSPVDQRCVSALFSSQLNHLPSDVIVVATATREAAIPRGIAGRFKIVTTSSPASPVERSAALSCAVRQAACSSLTESDIAEITASGCFGYMPRDYTALVHSASARCFERTGTTRFERPDVEAAMHGLRPSALKGFDLVVPSTTWADIGGNDAAKQVLQECIAWNLGADKLLFRTLKMRPPRGVLLFGPPGCSKTMLAKAIANQGKMHFISVKGPEVFSKWVGDSEKAVRDIFARARAAAPCVVFIDELDGMCGKRGKGGVADRVITQLLTELDGMPSETADDRPVIFLAATNRPDHIDGALLRPGRVDRKVFIGLPEEAERASIAQLHLSKMPKSDDVTAERIAQIAEGFSGAEVVALCKEAAMQALKESMAARLVTWQHVSAAREVVQPRTRAEDIDRYHRWARTGRFE